DPGQGGAGDNEATASGGGGHGGASASTSANPRGSGGVGAATTTTTTTTTGGGGATGMCPPYDISNGCDAGRLNEPDNCCVAGRSCLGGKCVGGRCEPVLIDGDASMDTRGIAVVGKRIFWSTGLDELIKSRATDGTAYQENAHDAQWIPSMAAD